MQHNTLQIRTGEFMDKKYFTGFCVMNSVDLRANPLHHSCLVFFEANCNEYGQLQQPFQVVDAYGFYSHPIPERPSIFTPVTLFAYAASIPRIRGSYGEWRRENIHDLALGRGLTGRLFDMDKAQFDSIQNEIKATIDAQTTFFTGKSTVPEREEYYQQEVDRIATELTQSGMDILAAEDQARNMLPVKEFTPSYNCKVAALDMIESSYTNISKKMYDYIEGLKGGSVSHIIPRLTYNLDDILIHAETDRWEVRGKNSKYPYYDWSLVQTDPAFHMYALDVGAEYIDKKGNSRFIGHLNEDEKAIVRELKIIVRLCEINQGDLDFKNWKRDISGLIKNIAGHVNKAAHIQSAENYLSELVSDKTFIDKTTNKLPPYLDLELRCLKSSGRVGRQTSPSAALKTVRESLDSYGFR